MKPVSYSFIDASSGSNINLNCNNCCKPVSIGFPFSYYNEKYSSLYVCDDGYISFSPATVSSTVNLCMPTRNQPNNIIAAFWDNLNPSASGAVYALLEGTAPNRRLTIEWLAVPHFPNTGNATFEITLYESTNQILVQYQDAVFGSGADNGATAVSGLGNRTGITGKQFSCKQPTLFNNTAWRAIPFNHYRLFNDTMESGINGWSTSGSPSMLFHQESAGCLPNYRSPGTSWYYGSSSNCWYDTGNPNFGLLTSPSLSADFYSNTYFWHRRQTEPGQSYDISWIQVSENGGSMSNQDQILDTSNLWWHHTTDISSHSEKNIQLGFYFDTLDAVSNFFLGWMIDDVEIWGCNVYGTSPIIALAYANPTPVCETAPYLLDGTGTYAIGCSNVLYQWNENGSPIPGATSITYTVQPFHAPGIFAYTLVATCSENPSQTATSSPASVLVVAKPTAIPNSLLVSKINAGTQLHFSWANIPGADNYVLFSDITPSGTFSTQAGSSTSGLVGLDTSMPAGSTYYLVAGQNATCGMGSRL